MASASHISSRLKSIWHRLLLLIFRCVLFSVKIKLLICAFVCVDLVRFASFRWLKRSPQPPPPPKRTVAIDSTRTWARGQKLFCRPLEKHSQKALWQPFLVFVCLFVGLFIFVCWLVLRLAASLCFCGCKLMFVQGILISK